MRSSVLQHYVQNLKREAPVGMAEEIYHEDHIARNLFCPSDLLSYLYLWDLD